MIHAHMHLYNVGEHRVERGREDDCLLRQHGTDHLEDVVDIKTEEGVVETNVKVAVCVVWGGEGGEGEKEREREMRRTYIYMRMYM
jgi:hypothetical protein